jgi:hypothetical protein
MACIAITSNDGGADAGDAGGTPSGPTGMAGMSGGAGGAGGESGGTGAAGGSGGGSAATESEVAAAVAQTPAGISRVVIKDADTGATLYDQDGNSAGFTPSAGFLSPGAGYDSGPLPVESLLVGSTTTALIGVGNINGIPLGSQSVGPASSGGTTLSVGVFQSGTLNVCHAQSGDITVQGLPATRNAVGAVFSFTALCTPPGASATLPANKLVGAVRL